MIVPEGHRVVLEIPEAEETAPGSVIIRPQTTQTDEKYASMVGKVVARGPTAGNCFKDGDPDEVGLQAVVGDSVVFKKYAGVNIIDPADQKEYRIINDEDVMAVIK